MRFKEYLIKEQRDLGGPPNRSFGTFDPRAEEKAKFYGEQLNKVFGLKFVRDKRKGPRVSSNLSVVYNFKSKGMVLGTAHLRIRPDSGDQTFGILTGGLFVLPDAKKGMDKVSAAYFQKFGPGGGNPN